MTFVHYLKVSSSWVRYINLLWRLFICSTETKVRKRQQIQDVSKNFTDEEGLCGDSHSCSEGVMETEYVCVGEAQDELIMNKLVQGMHV